MDINTATRKRILDLCNQRGITINKLGTMCGISQSTLKNIIGGRNKSTTISTVKLICDGLSMTVIEFFNCPLFENLDEGV